ncbi:pentapeptide repeat-containing protein, partial [Oscillatoriales cyanobacterium LEGE 11467]
KDVGPNLWNLLSIALGEKIGKKNFRTVFELLPTAELSADSLGSSTVPEPVRSPEANPHQDWGEAPDVSIFYGRDEELATLEGWIAGESCRLVALLGMGGMGKTALSVKLAQRISGHFEYVIWRSLRNAPPLAEVLRDLVEFLSDRQDSDLPDDRERQIARPIEYLREARCLVVLDNVEAILQTGDRVGRYRPGYEDYGDFFQQLGQTRHQSCIVLTSREKPKEIASLEGQTLPVRSLPVMGLPPADGQAILQSKALWVSETGWEQLIDRYAGNPLALKIATTTICDVFGGNVSEFLAQIAQGTAVFGDIRDLLEEQLTRLSPLETSVMYWLAIAREPIAIDDLRHKIVVPISGLELLEAVESLLRRSLIESGTGTFTQQPVVMEYTIERLIQNAIGEMQTEQLDLFDRFALIEAQAKDYIRNSQTRVILKPIAEQLLELWGVEGAIETKITQSISTLQNHPSSSGGYSAGNLINLAHYLGFDLTGYDFSNLTVWQAYLPEANLQNVNFTGADLTKSVFAQPLGDALVVALGRDGQLVTGDADGKILLWRVADGQQQLTCRGQTGAAIALAWSPEGKTFASGSDDRTLRLWDAQTGQCLHARTEHTDRINCISFSADGCLLATGSGDRTAIIWDVNSGQCLVRLEGHTDSVRNLAFSADGCLLATGSDDRTLRLWDVRTGECQQLFRDLVLPGETNRIGTVGFLKWTNLKWTHLKSTPGDLIPFVVSTSDDRTLQLRDALSGECFQTLGDHQGSVWAVACSRDGEILASSDDRTVRLWQVSTGTCLHTLQGFNAQVSSLAFDPDGKILATGSTERTIGLWEVGTGRALRTLRGHRDRVCSFALSPDGCTLATGSDDRAIRLWDALSGRPFKTLSGHRDWVWSLDFSHHSRWLASGSYDWTVKLWERATGKLLKTLRGHSRLVQAVCFSQDDRFLASASGDRTIKLWDIDTGDCLQTWEGHTQRVTAIAFRGDSQILASASYDRTIKLWEVSRPTCIGVLPDHSDRVQVLAWSPDGEILASGSDDRTVKFWSANTGECLQTWHSPMDRIHGIRFDAGGQLLVCGDRTPSPSMADEPTLQVWNASTGQCLRALPGHDSPIWSVRFPDERTLVSSSDDRAIKIWDLKVGECRNTLRTDKPYTGMNITGVRGISGATLATLKALGAIEI